MLYFIILQHIISHYVTYMSIHSYIIVSINKRYTHMCLKLLTVTYQEPVRFVHFRHLPYRYYHMWFSYCVNVYTHIMYVYTYSYVYLYTYWSNSTVTRGNLPYPVSSRTEGDRREGVLKRWSYQVNLWYEDIPKNRYNEKVSDTYPVFSRSMKSDWNQLLIWNMEGVFPG